MELAPMDNFVLTKCARVTCTDDGMNYCRLCFKHYCFEHLCTHLEQSRARGLGQRALEEAAQAYRQQDVEPAPLASGDAGSDFAALTDDQLRLHLRRHLATAKALHSELTRRWVATPAVQWPTPLPPSTRSRRGMDSYQFITNRAIRTILTNAKAGKLDAAALIAALTKLQHGAN